MRLALIVAALIALTPLHRAMAQGGGVGAPPAIRRRDGPRRRPATCRDRRLRIVWEVKNRFRLFRNEADFLRQVAASRGDGVLAAERRLEKDTAGFGWAKDVVANLCLDNSGNLLETCERDGERESYLRPRDHPIGVELSGPVPPGATCAWTFDDGEGQPQASHCVLR